MNENKNQVASQVSLSSGSNNRDSDRAEHDNSEVAIEMIGVHKWFGDFHVLKDINLTVRLGQRVVVCGPSGSGKSTVVRCINRLEEHQKGTIRVDGTELTGDRSSVAAIRSEVGMVFQQFNLFPHLTVLENLTLGPTKARGLSADEARDRAMAYLKRVRIPEQADKYPHTVIRRAAATSGDCTFTLHGAQNHVV